MTIVTLGLRAGEYLRLRPEHLHPLTHQVTIPGTKTAGSADVIRVDERMWRWVVTGVPSPVQYRRLWEGWKQALVAAGTDPSLRLHDLRHCSAQWAVDAGLPEASVQVFMRHASADMTRAYAKQRDKGMVSQALADVLVGAA